MVPKRYTRVLKVHEGPLIVRNLNSGRSIYIRYMYIYGTLTPSHKSGKSEARFQALTRFAGQLALCIHDTVRLVNCPNNCKKTV